MKKRAESSRTEGFCVSDMHSMNKTLTYMAVLCQLQPVRNKYRSDSKRERLSAIYVGLIVSFEVFC